jgi:hypothetical protein
MKLHQFTAPGETTTYEMFQEKCLGEACRPLNYPLNLALGTSQKFNFSSAKLDHINYRERLKVERATARRSCSSGSSGLVRRGVMVPGPAARGAALGRTPHEWHWPGFPTLDAAADTQADINQINAGTLTWREFWAQRGYDWRDVMAQQAQEQQEIEALGLTFGEPLRKTERLDESSAPGASAEAGRAEPILAYDPNQPRDDDGRFGEGGGSDKGGSDKGDGDRKKKEPETHDDKDDDELALHREHEDLDRDLERQRQDEATEKAREKEDAEREAAREKEDAEDEAIDTAREKEDAEREAAREKEDQEAGASEEATEKAREKEDAEREAAREKEDAEDEAIDTAREKEDEERAEKRNAEDAEIEDRYDADESLDDNDRLKEHAANDKAREKEDAQIEKSREKEDAQRDKAREKREAAREKEDAQIEKSREKEDASRERETEKREEAREKEDAQIEKSREKEDAQRDKAREKREAAREKEDAQIEKSREKEDAQRDKAREKEDAEREAAREKEDAAREAKQKASVGRLQKRVEEDAELDNQIHKRDIHVMTRPSGPHFDEPKRQAAEKAILERLADIKVPALVSYWKAGDATLIHADWGDGASRTLWVMGARDNVTMKGPRGRDTKVSADDSKEDLEAKILRSFGKKRRKEASSA